MSDIVVDDPGGLGFQIETIWAYVAVHADGDEGVCAFRHDFGTLMPMVAADKARVDQLRPVAEKVAALTGKPVKLVRFDRRVDVETIGADQ